MPDSIGQQLKHERETRRLTLEKVAEATRLRLHYLQALENDDYSIMSSAAQGRGFLRLYADFLGINLDAAVEEARHTDSPAPVPDAAPEPTPAPEPPASTPAPKAGRGGFWSRLLRRPSEEAESPAAESVPAAPEVDIVAENLPEVKEVPVPLSEVDEAPHKPASKKAADKTGKTSRAKPASTSKPRSAGKKKQSLSRTSKR